LVSLCFSTNLISIAVVAGDTEARRNRKKKTKYERPSFDKCSYTLGPRASRALGMGTMEAVTVAPTWCARIDSESDIGNMDEENGLSECLARREVSQKEVLDETTFRRSQCARYLMVA